MDNDMLSTKSLRFFVHYSHQGNGPNGSHGYHDRRDRELAESKHAVRGEAT